MLKPRWAISEKRLPPLGVCLGGDVHVGVVCGEAWAPSALCPLALITYVGLGGGQKILMA